MEQPTGNDHSLEQLVGLVTLTIVVILALIFWLIKPQISKLRDMNAQVKAKNEQLKATQAKLDSMNALQSEIANKKDLVDRLNIVLPLNNPQVADIVLELNTIANATSVDIKSITPMGLTELSPEETGTAENAQSTSESIIPSVVPYEMTFGLTGTFDNIKKFFASTEKNLKTFRIKSVNITSSTETNNPELSLEINAETYYQKADLNSTTQAE